MDKGGVRSTRPTPASSVEESAAGTALPTAINTAASQGLIRLPNDWLFIWNKCRPGTTFYRDPPNRQSSIGSHQCFGSASNFSSHRLHLSQTSPGNFQGVLRPITPIEHFQRQNRLASGSAQ